MNFQEICFFHFDGERNYLYPFNLIRRNDEMIVGGSSFFGRAESFFFNQKKSLKRVDRLTAQPSQERTLFVFDTALFEWEEAFLEEEKTVFGFYQKDKFIPCVFSAKAMKREILFQETELMAFLMAEGYSFQAIQATIVSNLVDILEEHQSWLQKDILSKVSLTSFQKEPCVSLDSHLGSGRVFFEKKEDALKISALFSHFFFDTTLGDIWVSKGATLKPFSVIEGPCWIGRDALVDGATLRSGVFLGEMCKVGGEIENSILYPFSNKHHAGFLGNSLIGSFVNLGALSTTSDLKNNYHFPMLSFPSSEDCSKMSYRSSRLKVGSFIGDFCKSAILSRFYSGSVVGIGCNLFGDSPIQGLIPSFAWGSQQKSFYELERFLQDAKLMMKRRRQAMSPELEKKIRMLYAQETTV